MSVLKEFRDFAVKGNVIDLAVGVIIGGAFGKIVDSLVNDIVMPVISTLLGGHIDFTNLFLVLGHIPDGVPRTFDALKKAGVPIFAYGNFITISINFILLAFVIFQMVKVVNKVRLMDAPPAPPDPTVMGVEALKKVAGAANKSALPPAPPFHAIIITYLVPGALSHVPDPLNREKNTLLLVE